MVSKLLKVQVIAEALDVPDSRIYELIRLGLLPAVRIGRQVRVSEDKLKEWIEKGGQGLAGGWRRN